MLHRTVWNPADEGVVGRWGAASASIDWCEANYQISFYVAEWCNTLTNVAFVALALFGLQKSVQNRLGGRFMLAYAGLALIGMLAFFIWNLDNLLCVQSTRLKRSLGLPLAWGLEGHGWWHLFTGLGVYMIICAMCYFTLSVRDSPEHYELHYAFGFLPWVCRTPKGFYAVEVDTSTSATESTRLIN
ncbi:hypothetical protein RQP46_006033 [Phenoliferia psychrophenolica]